MAPKLRNQEPLELNPSNASSEEGSDASSQDTTPPPPLTNPKPSSSAESDTGSTESDFVETNTRAPPPPPVVKPVATTPVKASNTKPQSLVIKSTATPTKRPAEPQTEKKESKMAKKGEGESEKSRPRVWSNADEIALITGMIDFEKMKGVSVHANKNAFYNFIKDSLEVDVSKLQVSKKIRHLKLKYLKQREPGFVLKPQEKPLFDLSHNVWGETNAIANEEPKSIEKKKGKKISTTPPSIVQFMGSDDHDPIHHYLMKKGLDLVESSEREELDKSWARLRKKELEVYVERCGLVYKQAKMVLKAHK